MLQQRMLGQIHLVGPVCGRADRPALRTLSPSSTQAHLDLSVSASCRPLLISSSGVSSSLPPCCSAKIHTSPCLLTSIIVSSLSIVSASMRHYPRVWSTISSCTIASNPVLRRLDLLGFLGRQHHALNPVHLRRRAVAAAPLPDPPPSYPGPTAGSARPCWAVRLGVSAPRPTSFGSFHFRAGTSCISSAACAGHPRLIGRSRAPSAAPAACL